MQRKFRFDWRAVIFDMDGVITNTMPYHFDAWLSAFSSVGIKVGCEDISLREGQDGLASVKEIYKQHKRKFSTREAQWLLRKKEALFKRIVRIKFIQGARSFLRLLKKRRFILGLVTGTSRHEVEKILPGELLKFFDVTVTGDEVNKGKPDPEPFLKALRILGMPAGKAVVIENAPFGIQAAKRARLYCIALETSLPKKYLREADIIFKSFAQLRRTIFF